VGKLLTGIDFGAPRQQIVEILGAKGYTSDDGKRRGINTIEGGDEFVEVPITENSKILPEVIRCLNGTDSGTVTTIELVARAAVLLVLEGAVTRQQIRQGIHSSEGILEVPEIKLGGKTVNLRIKKKAKHTVAGLNYHGQPLVVSKTPHDTTIILDMPR